MAEIEAFDPDMLVFLDETGSDKQNSIRQFGYGLRACYPQTRYLQKTYFCYRCDDKRY